MNLGLRRHDIRDCLIRLINEETILLPYRKSLQF